MAKKKTAQKGIVKKKSVSKKATKKKTVKKKSTKKTVGKKVAKKKTKKTSKKKVNTTTTAKKSTKKKAKSSAKKATKASAKKVKKPAASSFADVDGYIENLTADRQQAVTLLRGMIHSAFPRIEETLGFKMPTFVLDGETLCAVASQASYVALYVMPHDLMNEQFADELKPYNCGKSCIRFKEVTSSDIKLFKKILKKVGKDYSKSQFYGRMNPK